MHFERRAAHDVSARTISVAPNEHFERSLMARWRFCAAFIAYAAFEQRLEVSFRIRAMRRVFSIVLVLLFGFGPLASALPGAEDAALPACCRRNGAHHCAMAVSMMAAMARMAADGRESVSAPMTCPYYPGPVIAALMPAAHALAASPAALSGLHTTTAAPAPLLIAKFSAPNRTNAGRGPPVSLQS